MTRQIAKTNQIQGLDTALTNKQPNLVSGTNIKTINGNSLLGSGDIVISGGATVEDQIVDGVTTKAPSQNAVFDALANKSNVGHTHSIDDVTGLNFELLARQNKLVSGSNIKTINGNSLLGSGDIAISGGSGNAISNQETFTATAGQTVFNLSQTVSGNAIVTINGIQIKAVDYAMGTNKITFSSGLEAGDTVIVTYGVNLSTPAPTTDAYINNIEFTNYNIIKFIPTFGNSIIISEGVDFSNPGLKSKHYVTYLLNEYNIKDTPYGRIGGGLIGSGDTATTTPMTLGANRGVATGNGGYRFLFLGGYDRISDSTKIMSFIGLVGGVYSGGNGYSYINNTTTTLDSVTNFGLIGIGFYATDTNVKIITKKAGTGQVCTYTDLGTNFPVSGYQHYRLEIIKIAGSTNTVTINITNLLTGYLATYQFTDNGTTVNLPDLAEPLAPVFCIKPGTATIVSSIYNISFVRMMMLCGYTG